MKREKRNGTEAGFQFHFSFTKLFHPLSTVPETNWISPLCLVQNGPFACFNSTSDIKGTFIFLALFLQSVYFQALTNKQPQKHFLELWRKQDLLPFMYYARERIENQFTKLSLIAAAVMIRKDSMTLRKWTCEEPKKIILLPRCLVRKKRLFH